MAPSVEVSSPLYTSPDTMTVEGVEEDSQEAVAPKPDPVSAQKIKTNPEREAAVSLQILDGDSVNPTGGEEKRRFDPVLTLPQTPLRSKMEAEQQPEPKPAPVPKEDLVEEEEPLLLTVENEIGDDKKQETIMSHFNRQPQTEVEGQSRDLPADPDQTKELLHHAILLAGFFYITLLLQVIGSSTSLTLQFNRLKPFPKKRSVMKRWRN
ncbi:hypothetical protein [Sneathiella limimaris]|uniref:hypothetical protein n=1 Tax=Sneathiella limimaris TaxID=1964213 RepID=UPI00146BA4F1|nr:hypothetical protein [Sneathiella limimaris]